MSIANGDERNRNKVKKRTKYVLIMLPEGRRLGVDRDVFTGEASKAGKGKRATARGKEGGDAESPRKVTCFFSVMGACMRSFLGRAGPIARESLSTLGAQRTGR